MPRAKVKAKKSVPAKSVPVRVKARPSDEATETKIKTKSVLVPLNAEGPIIRDERVVTPREANEIDQAARIASNFKDYIPEKHMEFARAVLRDQEAHDDRAAVLDRDRQMAEKQGLEVTREAALQAAAIAQAKAERDEGYVDVPKEEWFSLSAEERQAMRDEEKNDREAAVHDSVEDVAS